MLQDVAKTGDLRNAEDEINDFYGAFTVYLANTMVSKKVIKQKNLF